MATRASIQVHLFTNGDIIIDELINAIDNPLSPAIVYIQEIQPNVSTPIYNPFSQFDEATKFHVTNVLIRPEASNLAPWTLSTDIVPPALQLHPTNPMLLSLISLGQSLYIYHTNATSVIFQFIWV